MNLIRFTKRFNYRLGEFLFDLKSRCYAFKHGHRYEATWDAPNWFLSGIIPILNSMIENSQGHPIDFCSHWDEEKNEYVPNEEGLDPYSEWLKFLQDMRDDFQHYVDVCENMVGFEEIFKKYGVYEYFGAWNRKMTDEQKDLYNKAYREWWEIEEEAVRTRDRALKNFAEHFDGLWN